MWSFLTYVRSMLLPVPHRRQVRARHGSVKAQGRGDEMPMLRFGCGDVRNHGHSRPATDQFNKAQVSNPKAAARAQRKYIIRSQCLVVSSGRPFEFHSLKSPHPPVAVSPLSMPDNFSEYYAVPLHTRDFIPRYAVRACFLRSYKHCGFMSMSVRIQFRP